jgi:transcription antitermination factor NusG
MQNWAVIRTRSRWEKKVASLLLQKGFETFCPLQKVKHQWSDRLKTVEEPLLKSYVFVKVAEKQRTLVRLTEGVINFVYQHGKPVVIKEKLILSLRQFQQVYPSMTVMDVSSSQSGQPGNSAGLVEKRKEAALYIEALGLVLVGCPEQSFVQNAITDKLK